MTAEQLKKRGKAAWSPVARKKRAATIKARKEAALIKNIAPKLPANIPGIIPLSSGDVSFTAAQVMSLLRELWRKGP